ncbi:MAG: Flp family type IVb pilin [Alphaproteobacteria bacterium]|nr:Flp family type IVb pilin [Alphaproteobacteria bacterium]
MFSFKSYLQDTSGATAIEYGIIVALISVVLITGATSLGEALNKQFDDISKKVPGVA